MKKPLSLQTRLLVAAVIVLSLFLSLTGFILDTISVRYAKGASRERLKSHFHAILAATPLEDDGSMGQPRSVDPRFFNPSSGLYGRIIDQNNVEVWRSFSAEQKQIPFIGDTKSKKELFNTKLTLSNHSYVCFSQTEHTASAKDDGQIPEKTNDDLSTTKTDDGPKTKGSELAKAEKIEMPNSEKAPLPKTKKGEDSKSEKSQLPEKTIESRYAIQLCESSDAMDSQIREFRTNLILWLSALTITLLVALALNLRWLGLGPMRRVSKELEDIKAGRIQNLSGPYPQELVGLTDGIKTLLASERAQQERYKNSLGDLAHSLKTPLAVVVGSIDQEGDKRTRMQQTLYEQVERMRQIIDYQLKRAAAFNRSLFLTPIPLKHNVERVVNTLDKAYRTKKITCHIEIDENITFTGDAGDLLELLGNLIDNAYKWCHSVVEISAKNNQFDHRAKLCIVVEDDGPGIPEDKANEVQNRGFRADESVSGQGIGLAVVKEIVHAYRGTLQITRSSRGGAKFILEF